MWRACRSAALRQLRAAPRATPLPLASYAAPLRLLAAAAQPSASCFSTLGGVDRDELLGRAPAELRSELGPGRLTKVKKALSEELRAMTLRGDASWDEIRNIFVAAQKVRAVPVMMGAFAYMEQHFAAQIDFMVYGEVYRQLLRARNGDKMTQIYEAAKPRYQSVPEMIYRFGITGKLEAGNLEGASQIWQEMLDAGHETPNEITSRLMMAYAKAGDADRVRELFEIVDPQIGQWHESAIDRVIVSMGIAREPEKAFEFYMNSSMKLNGGTLISLLSVCINNDCRQQAADILANRKKFDLELDARAYNRIMMTLEFLDKHGEIVDVLDEMRANNVAFDTMTRIIIDRNREQLEGTAFADEPGAAAVKESNEQAASLKHPNYSGQIRDLLNKNQGQEAAALVDTFVSPLTDEDVPEGVKRPNGALKIGPSLAKDAVRAYIMAGQLDKVSALLKTFGTIKGNYGHAVAEVMSHFKKPSPQDRNGELAYRANKAMLFQGRQIFRVDEALSLFRKFGDVDATMIMFEHVVAEYERKDASASEDEGGYANKQRKNGQRFSHFNIGTVINGTLQVLVENGKLDRALHVLEMLDSHELRVTPYNYVVVFTSMRDAGKKTPRHHHGRKGKQSASRYDADAYEQVWDDLKERQVLVSKAIVGNACPGFLYGNKRQRLKLLEAYADVKGLDEDDYVLPKSCYSVLLRLMAKEGEIHELTQLYEEATASLKSSDATVPKEWMTTVVVKLSSEGQVAEAHALLKQMPQKAGQMTHEALVAVLRGAINSDSSELTNDLLAGFEQAGFRMNLSDTYDLVHAARDHGLPSSALEIVRLFEASNSELAEGVEASIPAQLRSETRLRTIYRVVLQICEQNGQWKSALKLREQIAALWGEEAAEEHSSASKKPSREE
jgi:hypothetical protein